MTQAANLAALGTNAGTTGILPIAGGGTAGTGGAIGFKNKIINGAMQVWQRGTSSSSTGYQTVDRWSFYADSSRSISQSTDVPTGFTYSASVSGTGSTGLTQKIESVNTLGLVGQSITVSFWLKQSTGAGSNAIALNLYYPTATDNYNATTQIGSTQNFTTTTGWAQYSATFTNLPSGVANGIQLTIVTTSGSAVAFLLTGVQLEVGTAATNFDVRSYGTELGLCQRYCYVSPGFGSSYDPNTEPAFIHYYHSGYTKPDQFWEHISGRWPVTMRASPSISTVDSAGNLGKISIWTGGGGQVSTNQDYYTVGGTREACSVTKYYGSTLGHSCRIKAEAEL